MKRGSLGQIDHALAKQVELSTAEHLPFEELEFIDKAFGATVAVVVNKCSRHFRIIPPQTSSEPFE